MNQSMFFAVALALCALPCALGIYCYHCEPDLTTNKLCNMMNNNLMNVSCGHPNASCYRTMIKTNLSNAAEAYQFGCSNVTCPASQNTTSCNELKTAVQDRSGTLNMCDTECCMNSNNCMTLIMPTTTTSMVMSSTAGTAPPPPSPTTKAAGSKLYPAFGLLLITLFALV